MQKFIAYTPLLLLSLLSLGAAPPEGTVLPLLNPGFEQGNSNWSLDAMSTISTARAASGKYSLRILDKDGNKGGSQAQATKIPIDYYGVFELSGKVFPVSGSGAGLYVSAHDKNNRRLSKNDHLMAAPKSPVNAWQPFAKRFRVPRNTVYLKFWIHSYSMAVVEAYFDDLKITFVQDTEQYLMEMKAKWEPDLATIKQRLLEENLGPKETRDVTEIFRSQKADGSWDDIDYTDQERTYWKPAKHNSRVHSLALAYYHGASDKKITKDALGLAVGRGIDHWYEKRPKCRNWWWNVIGVPRTMYRTILLAEPALTTEQKRRGCEIIKAAKLGMTGQNLVWVAECTIARGCLENDALTVGEAFDSIAREIKITTGEGIQPDFSFYQHGQQLYSGGYGRGFSQDCPFFATLGYQTSFAFSDEKLDILVRYMLDGQQWMVRNQVFDYSACGRELARAGAAKSGGQIKACQRLASLGHPRTAELEAMALRLTKGCGEKTPDISGHRHFWRSEYSSQRRPDYFASVRVASKRVNLSETCNSENMRGEHLSDGLNYLYKTGEEYRRIMPVWEWRKLPGTTALQVKKTPRPGGGRGERSFAGGLSDGMYGMATMDFSKGPLKARKSWFFFDREYVCLGAGITCKAKEKVTTSLNQCLLNGKVTIADEHGMRALDRGTHELGKVRWVHHDGVAYVLPESGALTVRNDVQKGNWKRIAYPLSAEEISMEVFSAWIDHGSQINNADYAYIIVPSIQTGELPTYLANSSIVILANRPELQAVYHRDLQRAELVFFTPGVCIIPELGEIEVNAPCTLMLARTTEGLDLSIANPEHKGGSITVTLPGCWKGNAGTTAGGTTKLDVELPTGAKLAGSTVVLTLTPGE